MFRPDVSNGVCNPLLLSVALGFSTTLSLHYSMDYVTTLLSIYCSICSVFICIRMYAKCHPPGCLASTIVNNLIFDNYPRASKLQAKELIDCFHIPYFAPIIYSLFFLINGSTSSNKFLLCAIPFMYVYPIILPKLFVTFTKSFSFGEGSLVLQAPFLFIYKQCIDSIWLIEDGTSQIGGYVIIARMTLFVVILWSLLTMRYTSKFYFIGAVLIFGVYFPYLWLRLKRNLLVWVINDLSDFSDVLLLLFWASLVTFALFYVYKFKQGTSNTIARKSFHLLISLVYISGDIFNTEILYLCSMAMISIFLLVELVRYYQIKPFGALLNHYFKLFLDSKDSGPLVLTNIYLLVGVSIPIWLVIPTNRVLNLSGVLAIGIGDSAASIIGSKFGRMQWNSKSKKTIEGTFASLFAQMCTIWVIAPEDVWIGFGVSVVSSVIELLTDQVDNLIIPLAVHSVGIFLKH
ncbi:dolichol kinase [Lepeophtheirus salmonis]|uniref:dolichol kinase n=1 Tax=Lepeophtheirus salmonis TaxID=72036 RepID=UPI001AEAFA85|nr:dolichol kinase-like [Lepeophtheirus salmonis]